LRAASSESFERVPPPQADSAAVHFSIDFEF